MYFYCTSALELSKTMCHFEFGRYASCHILCIVCLVMKCCVEEFTRWSLTSAFGSTKHTAAAAALSFCIEQKPKENISSSRRQKSRRSRNRSGRRSGSSRSRRRSSRSRSRRVSKTVRNCNFHLCALHHIRSSLIQVVVNMMASSIIGSRIDYCNSLLIGICEQNLDEFSQKLLVSFAMSVVK